MTYYSGLGNQTFTTKRIKDISLCMERWDERNWRFFNRVTKDNNGKIYAVVYGSLGSGVEDDVVLDIWQEIQEINLAGYRSLNWRLLGFAQILIPPPPPPDPLPMT